MIAATLPADPSAPLSIRPLSPDRSRKLVEAALQLGAAGRARSAIEQALRIEGCPETEIGRLAEQALQFGESARRSRHEEALRARTRATRQESGRERDTLRERAWTLSIMAVCVGSVLGAVLWRLWS